MATFLHSLAELGPKVVKATPTAEIALEAAPRTPTSFVRLQAYLGDRRGLKDVPLMLPEDVSVQGTARLPHLTGETKLLRGSPKQALSRYEPVVIGAAFVDIRGAAKPVLFLHSAKEDTVITYIPAVDIALLELDVAEGAMGALAFERGVLRGVSAAAESMYTEQRLEEAVQSRMHPLDALPEFAFTGEYHVIRHGTMPWLSLRVAKDRGELLAAAAAVEAAAQSGLCALCTDPCLLVRSWTGKLNSICLFHTDKLEASPEVDVDGEQCFSVASSPILSHLALALLSTIRDSAENADGTSASTAGDFAVASTASTQRLLDDVVPKEVCVIAQASGKESPQAFADFSGPPYTLETLVAPVCRTFDTELLVANSSLASLGDFFGSVCGAIFARAAVAAAVDRATKNAVATHAKTPLSRIGAIGSCLDASELLVALVFNSEGRLEQKKAFGADRQIDLTVSGARRLIVSTKTTTFVLDGSEVALLHAPISLDQLDEQPAKMSLDGRADLSEIKDEVQSLKRRISELEEQEEHPETTAAAQLREAAALIRNALC